MWHLAGAFLEIALHRRGPDSLPASRFLLLLLLGVYFPVNVFRLYAAGTSAEFDFALVLADTILFFVFVYVLLRFFRRSARFQQTASALLGADILINLIGIPLAFLNSASVDAAEAVTLPSILSLALFIWWIDVAGFIVSRAIEQPYAMGVMFVIFYVVAMLAMLTTFSQPPV